MNEVTDETFARLFLGDNPGITGTALELEDRVRQYLEAHGLTRRSPLLIAVEVSKLSAPSPSPEMAAFEAQMEGVGDQVPDYSQMPMADYVAARRNPGMPGANNDLVSFLGGLGG